MTFFVYLLNHKKALFLQETLVHFIGLPMMEKNNDQ